MERICVWAFMLRFRDLLRWKLDERLFFSSVGAAFCNLVQPCCHFEVSISYRLPDVSVVYVFGKENLPRGLKNGVVILFAHILKPSPQLSLAFFNSSYTSSSVSLGLFLTWSCQFARP